MSTTSTATELLLLLDTHTWIWSVEGNVRRVGRRSRSLLARAEVQDGVRISAASVFEVSALHVAGRVHLVKPVDVWVQHAFELSGVRLAELTPTIAINAGYIPRTALADPLDRMIAATARYLDATLLTGDRALLAYAQAAGTLRVHDVGL